MLNKIELFLKYFSLKQSNQVDLYVMNGIFNTQFRNNFNLFKINIAN